MNIRELAAPPVEPITLAEAQAHVVIGAEITATQAAYITGLIQVAREYAEHYTGRVFVQRPFEISYDGWADAGDRYGNLARDSYMGGGGYSYEGASICLPNPPLVRVDYIRYVDMGGVLQTLDPSLYQVDVSGQPGRVKPAYLQIWPVVRATDFNSVRIGFTAGYPTIAGASPSDYAIPAVVKQWMKLRVGQWFEYREPIVIGTIVSEIKRDYVDALLDPVKVWSEF